MCLDILTNKLGFEAPHFIHQIMPVRGFFPQIVRDFTFSFVPDYLECMHSADRDLVESLDTKLVTNELPMWWTNTQLAPLGAQGVEGYNQACSLGVPWAGYCVVPSKLLFQIMLEIFRTSVQGDTYMLN